MRMTAIARRAVLAGCLAACGPDAGSSLARPVIDTLPGGAVLVHNTGPAGWVDTNGWRLVETGRMVARDSGDTGIVNPRAVVADEGGRLYVVESAPLAIKVFDRTGAFVRSIGREGAGPGEFRSPLPGVHRNHLVVHDPNLARLSIFDTSGTYITSIPAACCHYRDLPVTREGIVAVPGPNTRPEFSNMFLRFTADGRFVDTVYVPRGGEEQYWEVKQGSGSMRMTIPFTPAPRVAFAPNGDIVHAWTGDYRIAIGPDAGDTSRVITLDRTPLERPEAERRARLDAIIEPNVKHWGEEIRNIFRLEDIPATATPLENLMVAPDGSIWAQVYAGDSLRTHFDVFDSTGVYQGRVVAPWSGAGGLAWAGPDELVRLGESDEGYPEIIRYRVDRSPEGDE